MGKIQRALRPLTYIPLLEWPRFLAYRRGHGSGEAVFHVKGVAHGLRVRAGTTDAVTMESVFGDAHHLPRHRIKDDCVIVDLGANAGYAAAHLASLYPKARVIAVELDADNAELARRNLVPFCQCELVNAAIWVVDGEVGYEGQTKDGYAITGGGLNKAPAVTIETLLDDRGIECADFVKMDVEGAEWALFQEPKWLSRVNSISVEVHRPEWLEPIDAALLQAGFHTARSDTHWSAIFAYRKPAASP